MIKLEMNFSRLVHGRAKIAGGKRYNPQTLEGTYYIYNTNRSAT